MGFVKHAPPLRGDNTIAPFKLETRLHRKKTIV
jgi:hypothetical protein